MVLAQSASYSNHTWCIQIYKHNAKSNGNISFDFKSEVENLSVWAIADYVS